MKHLFIFVVGLALILIFYTILKKNKIIEGHRGGGGGFGGNGLGYNSFYYPDNLCYDSLGNLTYCLIPSFYY